MAADRKTLCALGRRLAHIAPDRAGANNPISEAMPKMRNHWIAPLALALAGLAGSAGAAPTSVSADITSSITWGGAPPGTPTRIACTLADPIVLENPIFVKNGATLTVLAGCVVRGQPRTAAVLAGSTVGTPGALIVT